MGNGVALDDSPLHPVLMVRTESESLDRLQAVGTSASAFPLSEFSCTLKLNSREIR